MPIAYDINVPAKLEIGNKVTILNETSTGRPFIEGDAELIERLPLYVNHFPMYVVQFDGENEPLVERIIYSQTYIENEILKSR